MLFNSYGFIFVFCPLVFLGVYICKRLGERRWKQEYTSCILGGFLLLTSLLFYGWSYPNQLLVLLFSMGVNYLLGVRLCREKKNTPLLFTALLLNLGLLAIFKYVDGGSHMPLGLSFYTFTQIAFLMECYRGDLKRVSGLEYGLYVSFFPKLMQGPIARPQEIIPQIADLHKRRSWEEIYQGAALFILGLFKKVILADTLGTAVDFGYANLASLNAGDGLVVMLSYTLQLYFDFSGYCDMAMGIAGLLGIELPVNFDSPYKAANILEFWKGWHRTLTGFFTRYLYIPLGGNRKGKARTCFNCLIVFFVSGLWHGIGVTFIVWGMLHGILYVLTRMWMERPGKAVSAERKPVSSAALYDFRTGMEKNGGRGLWESLRRGGCVLATFLFVNVAWIFFRAPSLEEAFLLLRTILSGKFTRLNWDLAGCFNLDEFWYVIKVLGIDGWQYSHYILMFVILAALLALVFFAVNSVRYVKQMKPGVAQNALLAVLFVWSVLSVSGVSSFLYVNF